MFRAVLDANQFVSAVIRSAGNPAKVLNAWRADRYELVVSPPIIREIRRVLMYPRLARIHRKGPPEIDEFLDDLAELAFVASGMLDLRVVSRDPTDNIYISAAVEATARFIVTGDSDLLELEEYEGISIVTAREFLGELARMKRD